MFKPNRFVFICFFSFLLSFAGCAHVQEAAKEIWGTSIVHLERARSDAKIVTVKKARHDVFERCVALFKEKGANVYLKGKNEEYLAAMNFTGFVDTTQVGLFFTPVDQDTTKIEVASLSPRLAQTVAGMLSDDFREKSQEVAL